MWGYNANGQLGLGDTTNRSSPVQVGSGTDWTKISVNQSTLAIKGGNTLWGWGRNFSGEIGVGDTTARSSPVQVGSLTTWSDVVTGNTATQAIKTDGTLWSWGVAFVSTDYIGPSAHGGGNISSPVQVGALTTWTSLGKGTARYSAGHAIITTSNTLYAWGGSGHDRSGQTTTYLGGSESICPTCVPYPASVDGRYGANSPISVVTSVSSVSSGTDHALFIKTNGTLWAWGSNLLGQINSTNNNPLHYLAVDTTGMGICTYPTDAYHNGFISRWENSPAPYSYYILYDSSFNCIITGDDTTMTTYTVSANTVKWGYSSPVQIGSDTNWSTVSAGNGMSAAIKTTGTLWTWGINGSGQLAQSDLTNRSSPTQVGSGTDWATISCGDGYCLAVKTNGTLWAWGYNAYGQLGQGDTTGRSSPVQIGSRTNWLSTGISAGYFGTSAGIRN